MRALAITATGSLDHLQVQDVPTPSITRPDEVRVRLKAAALNRLDLFVVEGLPGKPPPFPHVVGSDGAGVVDAVGADVTAWAPGDAVMINPGVSCGQCWACAAEEESLCTTFAVLGEHRAGTVAEYVVVPAANLARVPEGMSWPVAAAFSLATLTAWRMLVTRAQLRAGEWALVWGIGGGVALAAVRIAVHLGARVIATSGTPAKLDAARQAGADELVDHRQDDVVARVRTATAGRGADVVVDSVGAATWPVSLRALRRGGRLVTCGATSGPHVQLDVRKLFWHQWSLLGSTMGSRREYAELVAHARAGRFWPVVDDVVPLDRAAEAFRRLAAGEQTGKLVIEVGT